MAAGKYPSCLLGSRACRTGWLRTVIFLLSVALALNLGLLLGVRLSAAILDSVPAAVPRQKRGVPVASKASAWILTTICT